MQQIKVQQFSRAPYLVQFDSTISKDKHKEYFCNAEILVISSFKIGFQEIAANALNEGKKILIKFMMEAGLLNTSPLCNREHEEQRMKLQVDIQIW